MIVKKTNRKTVKKAIEKAHFRHIDTGKKQTVQRVDSDGNTIEESRPILQKVYVEPVFQDIIEETIVFCVNDGIDEHQFISEEEAKEFLNGNTSTN